MTGHKQRKKDEHSRIINLQENKSLEIQELQKLGEKYNILPSDKTSSRC